MRFLSLDLNLLAALDKLLRLRSVSRAADEMSITQSAMSNALNRLRQYFDDPLLVQIGRKMELTPRAETLVLPVRDILVRIEATVAVRPDFDPKQSTRSVAIMVSDYTLFTLLPVLVRDLAKTAPMMQLKLKPQQSYPSAQLERGETDLLIAPSVFCSSDHPSEVLFEDPMMCVLDAENPAAAHLDLETFASLPHVGMQPPMAGKSYAGKILADSGLDAHMAVECFSLAALPELVKGTNRIALVQGRLANRMARSGGFTVLPPPLDLPPLEQRVQWHEMRGMDPALAWIRERLHAAAAADPS